MHRQQGLFLSVFVDDFKMAGKKQNLEPMEKPTTFLDQVYLGWAQIGEGRMLGKGAGWGLAQVGEGRRLGKGAVFEGAVLRVQF